MYDYQDYIDIPTNILEFVLRVSCVDKIQDLSLRDINIFLEETQEYYQQNGQNMEDFLDD